ncbi:hypothetical protein [Ruminococcus sp.]|uniref:hypothetical protein n=1 Tax=Ruminococcus sp. TaxID=41978 RepID=UPI0025D6ABB4|nr:hypothetical protein [Ruminococcus sp.]MBD9051967.1 hypothetical protein [Ruminococcus sp.]
MVNYIKNKKAQQLNPNTLYNLDTNPSSRNNYNCYNDQMPNTIQEYGYEIPSILDLATLVSPTSPNYHSFSPDQQAPNRRNPASGQSINQLTQTIPAESQNNEVANDLAVREIQNIDSTQPYNPETLPTPAMINEQNMQNMQNMQNNQTAMSTESLLTDIKNPYEVTAESVQYLNGFIRTQIGRKVSIDFLVGSNTIVTKSGYLLGVAANYILINELDTNDLTTCDFYNIKFIRFYFN